MWHSVGKFRSSPLYCIFPPAQAHFHIRSGLRTTPGKRELINRAREAALFRRKANAIELVTHTYLKTIENSCFYSFRRPNPAEARIALLVQLLMSEHILLQLSGPLTMVIDKARLGNIMKSNIIYFSPFYPLLVKTRLRRLSVFLAALTRDY